MALNLCRRSLSTIKKCSALINAQSMLTNQIPITTRILFDAKPILHAGFATEKTQQHRLGLRKQNLPSYPHIECIRELQVETFLPSHYKIVKYGDYEFQESGDGYVMVYIQGYHHPKLLDTKSGYAVYFGENHPLNLHGAVLRRQRSNHAKMYGFLKGLNQIPENLLKKVCVCIDEIPFLTFIDKSLRSMSENSFRSVYSGKLNKDLETSMEINKVLRTRQDLTLRLKYVPNDLGVNGMYYATKLAIKAAEEATQAAREEKKRTVQ